MPPEQRRRDDVSGWVDAVGGLDGRGWAILSTGSEDSRLGSHGVDRDKVVSALRQKCGGVECGGLVELTASMAVRSIATLMAEDVQRGRHVR
ncbi:hypothetical protein M0R45_009127 [Rubus argutus]|uniref:Uncharacterized protein n=1 Tax=Rubus argutus TaxID=59490 RepID=A0AAW1Y3M9_RUBAR